MNAKIIPVSTYMVFVISAFLAIGCLILPVSCIQIGNWNIELIKISNTSSSRAIQARANLTSSMALVSVETCYYFEGQSQAVNVSMTLLDNSSLQGSTSTLWSAEFSAPGNNFTLAQQLYVTNIHGDVATFPIAPVRISDQMSSFHKSISVLDPPMEYWILLMALFCVAILPIALYARHHKHVINNSHFQA